MALDDVVVWDQRWDNAVADDVDEAGDVEDDAVVVACDGGAGGEGDGEGDYEEPLLDEHCQQEAGQPYRWLD